jgi:hypothetical protein
MITLKLTGKQADLDFLKEEIIEFSQGRNLPVEPRLISIKTDSIEGITDAFLQILSSAADFVQIIDFIIKVWPKRKKNLEKRKNLVIKVRANTRELVLILPSSLEEDTAQVIEAEVQTFIDEYIYSSRMVLEEGSGGDLSPFLLKEEPILSEMERWAKEPIDKWTAEMNKAFETAVRYSQNVRRFLRITRGATSFFAFAGTNLVEILCLDKAEKFYIPCPVENFERVMNYLENEDILALSIDQYDVKILPSIAIPSGTVYVGCSLKKLSRYSLLVENPKFCLWKELCSE